MNKKIVGGLELLLASVIYGFYGLLYRYVGQFGEYSQGWIRSLIIIFLLLFSIFLFNKEDWTKYKLKDLKWFALWVIPSSFQPVITFIVYNKLPVGLVFYLMYAGIMVSSFLAGKIFFKEKMNSSKMTSLVLVILGISFIYGSNISYIGNIYVLLALLSGFLVGLWNTLTKKLSGKYSSQQMVFTDNLSVIFIGLAMTFITKEQLPLNVSTSSWIWIILFAIASLIAGRLVIKGFRNVEAQVGSLILPMQIIFGSILGYIFFKETLSVNTYLGGAFIFIAAIIPYIKDIKKLGNK